MTGKKKPFYDWDEYEVQFLMTRPTDEHGQPWVRNLDDFFRPMNISKHTYHKHTTGWAKKREAIMRRANEKAITRYENNTAAILARQGKLTAAAAQLAFNELLEKDKETGKVLDPPRLKAGVAYGDIIRLFTESMKIEQKITALDKVLAESQGFKAGKTGKPGDAELLPPAEDQRGKLLAILKDKKALGAAETILEAIGTTGEDEDE